MKKFFKILGILAGIVILIIAGGIIYINTAFPDVNPPENIKVEVTPARLERGRYIANHVAVCLDCHSDKNEQIFAMPVIEGTEGKGGEVFGEDIGFPGKLVVKNITPAALENWSDGELI